MVLLESFKHFDYTPIMNVFGFGKKNLPSETYVLTPVPINKESKPPTSACQQCSTISF